MISGGHQKNVEIRFVLMKKLFVSIIALGAFAAPAMAADLYTPVEPLPAPIPFSWNGFYIGGNVGWGFAESDWDVYDDEGDRLGGFSLNPDGFLGGGQIGFNFDNGNGFVWGGEAEFTFGGGSDGGWFDDNGYDGDSSVNFLMTLGPKVGISMDRVLFYVEGGLALADIDHKGRMTDWDNNGFGDTNTGWFIGAGSEYAFDDHWSARLEYNYVDMGSHSLKIVGGNLDGGRIKVDNDMHVIKGGINYRF